MPSFLGGVIPGLIYTPIVSGGSLLLDGLSVAPVAAFSFRKLRSAYAGSCVRVRRSSDNAEQDIGFDVNGRVDQAAMATFCGGGSGYIPKWYNQAPSATFDLANATANTQPQCWTGTAAQSFGTAATQGSMYFTRGTVKTALSGTLTTGGVSTLQSIVVAKKDDAGTDEYDAVSFMGSTDSSLDPFHSSKSMAMLYTFFGNAKGARFNEAGITGSSASAAPFVFSTSHDATDGRYYRDGALTDTLTGGTGAYDTTGTLYAGSVPTNDVHGWLGWIAEIIIALSVNTSDRAACEASAKTYWGTP